MTVAGVNGFPNGGTSKLNVISGDYEAFLHLLTTQLQHQDPTDPTDTNALTQQIASLSQVEQQLKTNDNLQQLIGLYGSTQYNSLVSYIGKQIEAPGGTGALQNGKAVFVFYAQQEPKTVNIEIKDNNGAVVYNAVATKNEDGTYDWTDLAGNPLDPPPALNPNTGRNEFVWNGKNNSGTEMPDDSYHISVTAKDASDNPITTQTYTTGIITSVDSSGGQVYLSVGDILSIPLEVITSIRQPTVI